MTGFGEVAHESCRASNATRIVSQVLRTLGSAVRELPGQLEAEIERTFLVMKPSRRASIGQPELWLLLQCARRPNSGTDATAIRQVLEQRIDWTVFAHHAVRHEVASLVGNSLEKLAPDRVPNDVLAALLMTKESTQARNKLVVEAFRRSAAALANCGMNAIWLGGPILGMQAYGDPALRAFDAPTLLVREQTAAATIEALRDIGYQQDTRLTAAQLDFIRRLQGREILLNRSLGISAQVYTRLTPLSLELEIDHEGLWRRAQSTPIMGQTVQTLSPEDQVLALSIRSDRDLIWPLGKACDFAAFIASQPKLDWNAIAERARKQGCLRMLLLAVSLAQHYFAATVVDELRPAVAADPMVERMIARTVAHWHLNEPRESLSSGGFSAELLRLHHGSMRQARYLVRSLLLPTPAHVSRVALPPRLTNPAVYVLIKVVQEAAILPLLRTYRTLRAQARSLRKQLASHKLGLAFVPCSSEQRLLLRRYHDARAAAERAVAVNPHDTAGWQNLGDALFRLERHEAAIAAYDKALAGAPEDQILWLRRAAVVRAGGRRTSHFDTEQEATRNPKDANAWVRHAASLAAAKRFAEAVIAADSALAINPRHLVATRVGIRSRIMSCDWRRSEEDEARVADAYDAGVALLTPFANRAISDSERQNLIAAQLWAGPFVRRAASPSPRIKHSHDRIRLAYLCAEFHEHPAGRGIVGVLEHHDRSRFETTGISLGGPNSSAIRQRIEAACDRFISVHEMTDEQVATLMMQMEIDIAVDLDRFAVRARPGILALRPAPLQLNYFGNSCTTGAPFFDYIVADPTLIPTGHSRHYTEKVVYLPNSYQCNDSKHPLPLTKPSRAEAGLPESGFVFCCFNNHYKIRPAVFDVWMRLLDACPGSVLWLYVPDLQVIHNLRREAAARGVASERIVFAPWVPNLEHLTRLQLADLFLDTLPCNAHVTASDALWAGVPILTCLANTFSGRVGASLLRAIGLPEMVTESLAQYEALAMSLARDPQRLAAIRTKLARNRATEPLFDTAQFTRDLEAAFNAMWRRHQAGLAPEAFAV